ncbi:aromatic amino acid hydroxylase [Nonlabens sp. Ci31]|uniref:aromatic amino acid hydroxylase n=1 Tax=Nonlabens sp. Ci31 TaxID=2608253 RepID=UPI001462BDFB|nr:aromatic amino acid hydroxylase [Nonlabens sp. Ci31]QJP34413.1 aromatic amino acid hydroxylase [Nonlabens sp. Ci31]
MLENIEINPLIERLPPHLKQFIKPQNYKLYTYQDQAVWRHVMRKNVEFLSQVAHGSYLAGLKKTGLSIDRIPSMYGMNRILKEIGWAAVAVDGFIPPAAFMEFQAYKILVIAADIRKVDNIEYTPAPDIIHEAAGHAPIIASPDYAEYLRRFGEIGSKAISSAHDHEMYEAVRKISILKEVRSEKKDAKLDKEITVAEAEIERLQNKKVVPSEMSLIRNLHWWTVEYGLVGTLENPKLYGAGLLSSIGESKSCLEPSVEKRSYSIDAAYQDFDITRKQPHLYVTPNFAHLSEVLEEFANTMAVRKGGHRGLQKLIDSKSLGTIELSTGLQVSGLFTRMITNDDNEVVFFQTFGESALAYREKELISHGRHTHKNGFLSPLGKLKGINLAIEDMGPRDLQAYHFYDNERIEFTYESGIKVEGLNVTGQRNVNGKLMLIQFTDCTVSYKDEILFSPADGMLNLAVGKEIASAYAGPADYYSFDQVYHESDVKTSKSIFTKEQVAIQGLYEKVRHYREEDKINKPLLEKLKIQVQSHYPDEWLLVEEIEELIS